MPSFLRRLWPVYRRSISWSHRQLRETPLTRAAILLTLGILTLYVPLASIAGASNSKTGSEHCAAVLISAHAWSGDEHWLPAIAMIGSFPAWTLYFNSRGQKVEYLLSATQEDFLTVLRSDRYQSVVLVGHGTFNSWHATDGEIDNHDVTRMLGRFNRKQGEWFQLTCPSKDFSSDQLGELVVGRGRAYYYRGDVTKGYDLILDAVTGFQHIKSEMEGRSGQVG